MHHRLQPVLLAVMIGVIAALAAQQSSLDDRFKQLDHSADVKVTLLNGKTTTFPGVKADQFLNLNLKTSQMTPLSKEPTP